MSEQKTLESFFTAKPSRKRTSTDAPQPASKKRRVDTTESLAVPDAPAQTALVDLNLNEFALNVIAQLRSEEWKQALMRDFGRPEFRSLMSFLETELKTQSVYPPLEDVWNAFNYCPLDHVKVVVIGQDPYHGPNQSHGLAFSVRKGIKVPPSLVNMYKELAKDLPDFKVPKHGNLEHWAKQGVFLLNACLTVRKATPTSHQGKGWEIITDSAIRLISATQPHVVFFLWGAFAQKKTPLIDSHKHLVLKSTHPSPLSAHRGWFGNHHFSKANEFLVKHGIEPIDWQLPETI